MKQLMKRLLGMMLVIAMVIGMIPVSGISVVEAADYAHQGETYYLDASKQLDGKYWDSDGVSIYAYVWYNGNTNDGDYKTASEVVEMQYVSSREHCYSITLKADAYKIQVVRTKKNDVNTSYNWGNALRFEEGRNNGANVFEVIAWNGDNSVRWTSNTYNDVSSDTTSTESIYYVQTDLVDYLNDDRIKNNQVTGYFNNNEGDKRSAYNPYGYLDYVISNKGYSIPLYFGALNFISNRYGYTGDKQNLTNWNSGANVAPAKRNSNGESKGEGNYNASAQGLVDSILNANGTLQQNGQELPYFSKNLANNMTYNNGQKVMAYYSNLEFPFRQVYDETTGITTYSYDSATDYAVYYDYSNKKLTTSNVHVNNPYDGNYGFYPLNQSSDSGDNVNMGFGTKFTIQFTVADDGVYRIVDSNGNTTEQAITFNFTGDDDVWVFIDNQLVLDMGGAHTKSSGSINFKTLTATVDNAYPVDTKDTLASVTTWEQSSYVDKGLGNYVYGDTGEERDTVASGKEETAFPKSLQADFKEEYRTGKSEVHTLTMFYMERGMYDSNMSISFSMSPIPSGLVVSKDINEANVNAGLVDEVENIDSFYFDIDATKLSDNTEVEFQKFTLTNHEGKSTSGSTNINLISGVRADQYAHAFLKSNGTSAFEAGTRLVVQEKIQDTVFQYDENATIWKVYDADNEYQMIENNGSGTGLTATFAMGTAASDTTTESYNYSLNFVNTMKVGSVSLKKKCDDTVTVPEDGFEFKIAIDLDGDKTTFNGYESYAVKYKIGEKEYETDSDGTLKLEEGQTAVIEGIPVGAKVKITEVSATGSMPTEGYEQTVTVNESQNYEITFNNEAVKVSYGFYLVDENGNPITITTDPDTNEETEKVVVFSEKTVVAYDDQGSTTVTKDVTVGEASKIDLDDGDSDTTTEVESIVSQLEAQGYELYNPNADYTVTVFQNSEDGTNSWDINDTTNTTYVTGYDNNNSATTEDSTGGEKDYTNTTVWFAVRKIKANPETIVIDFGLPADIDVLANDDFADMTKVTITKTENTGTNYGTVDVKVNDDSQTVRYTPNKSTTDEYNKSAMQMEEEDIFSYTATYKKREYSSTVTVIPATNIYFEDDFLSFSDSTVATEEYGVWSPDGKTVSDATQAEDRPGVTEGLANSIDANNVYGYDDAYKSSTEFSLGSAHKVTVDVKTGAASVAPTAKFTFTGTGFDVISLTDNRSGAINVAVYERNEDGSNGTVVKNYIVNNSNFPH